MTKEITHYKPEKARGKDRRKVHVYVADDRRSGIGCRRRQAEIAHEIMIASRRVKFYSKWEAIGI